MISLMRYLCALQIFEIVIRSKTIGSAPLAFVENTINYMFLWLSLKRLFATTFVRPSRIKKTTICSGYDLGGEHIISKIKELSKKNPGASRKSS